MLSRLLLYLKFLMRSTNHHGVHSPFVYKYITQAIYSKSNMSSSKSTNVLLKSIDYFGYQAIALQGNQELQPLVHSTFPNLKQSTKSIDLVFSKDLNAQGLHQLLASGVIHNDSMIFLDALYQSPGKLEDWNTLIELPLVTVSIDMFHCGVIFVRKEQEKEHFTIRI